jgi:hypothetical protein
MTLLLAAVHLLAQDTNVRVTRSDLTLQGTVTDQMSALIPGVIVHVNYKACLILSRYCPGVFHGPHL